MLCAPKKTMSFTYPIVTWKHKMVSTTASVPIRMLFCYELDVVNYNLLQPITIEVSVFGDRHINKSDNVGYAKGHEKYVCLFGMASPEGAFIPFYFIDELPFYGVDVVQWPTVDQRLLSFIVGPYLEPLHHLYVAPGVITYK